MFPVCVTGQRWLTFSSVFVCRETSQIIRIELVGVPQAKRVPRGDQLKHVTGCPGKQGKKHETDLLGSIFHSTTPPTTPTAKRPLLSGLCKNYKRIIMGGDSRPLETSDTGLVLFSEWFVSSRATCV